MAGRLDEYADADGRRVHPQPARLQPRPTFQSETRPRVCSALLDDVPRLDRSTGHVLDRGGVIAERRRQSAEQLSTHHFDVESPIEGGGIVETVKSV